MGMLCGFSQGYSGEVSGVATITVGTNATAHGYLALFTPFGSIDPDPYNPAPLGGQALKDMHSTPGTLDFVIGILDPAELLLEDAWTSVRVQDGTGAIRTYLAADNVNFTRAAGVTYWSFGTGGLDPVWVFADAGKERVIVEWT